MSTDSNSPKYWRILLRLRDVQAERDALRATVAGLDAKLATAETCIQELEDRLIERGETDA